GSTIEEWINARMPVWESVEDPRFTAANDPNAGNPELAIPTGSTGHLLWRYIRGSAFTAYGYDANNSAATNFVTFVEGPLAVYRQLEGRPRPQISKYNAKFSTRYRLSGITDHHILRNVTVGGSLRWIDKRSIGFLGVQSLPDKITQLDTNKPVFSPAETQVDLFVAYSTKLFHDKVRATFRLNARNIGEPGGGLLVTQVFPDGSPLAYRIKDPQQFILSANFEL
ncbi:MAG TPA: TonB-dependent receptor, partial [Opitutus sp.]|nr:TonB-dependent receptor [Opitutus sp.]